MIGWYAYGNVCKFPKINNFCNIYSDWMPKDKQPPTSSNKEKAE